MRRAVRVDLVVVVLVAGCATAWGEEPPEARAILEQFARQSERVESLEVVYRLETRSDLKPEQLLALAQFGNQAFLPKDEWREAFKGKKLYRRQIQPERVEWLTPPDANGLLPPREPAPSAPKVVRENWKLMKAEYDRAVAQLKVQESRGVHLPRRDPSRRDLTERDVTRAYNGHTLWMRRPVSATVDEYVVWPTDKAAHWFSVSAYQSAVGLQAPDSTPAGAVDAAAQAKFRVAPWVKDQAYEVEARTEVVDGSTCVVLTGNLNALKRAGARAGDLVDRVWLDRDHGLAVRKREFTTAGTLAQRWINTDLKEVEPGLWLPYQTVHEQYAADAPPDFQGKPVVVEEVRVEKLQVNQVKDALFDMAPRKGDRVEDLRGSL